MHILYVHPNYPAQFGHIARRLVRDHGCRCTFVSRRADGPPDGVERIRYRPRGGATVKNHPCTRPFENAVAHAHGVLDACRRRPDLHPDLIVGHSGFGSTVFLGERFDCPLINYFEYFYRAHDGDIDYRPEFSPAPLDPLRARCRNAMILLDLDACTAGYAPTRFQRDLLPAVYHPRVEVLFDGVDTDVWRRRSELPACLADTDPRTRVVTYVSRGLEVMRGFDIFLRVAKRVYRQRSDIRFVVVGSDRTVYGGDERWTRGLRFREWALAQDDYDPSRFLFTGPLPADELARLLSRSDLHVYLTVPFVTSWSLFDALACGCVVLGSDTAPVSELIRHGHHGLLAPFYDIEGMADLALRVLDDPAAHRPLGEAAATLVREHYSLDRVLPRMLDLYRRVLNGGAT